MGREDDPSETPESMPSEVVVPIEDHIDLHSFRPQEVRSVVDSYLDAARDAGFGEVRLVHGRGIGVQRKIVRSLLERRTDVLEYADAPPGRGGWGATIVRLRVKPSA